MKSTSGNFGWRWTSSPAQLYCMELQLCHGDVVDAAAVVADDLQGIGAAPLHVLLLVLAQLPYGRLIPKSRKRP